MPEELIARKLVQYVAACDTGRHVHHPQQTCEEYEEFAAHVRAWWEQAFAEAFAAAERRLVTGSMTGEPRGLAAWKPSEPTAIERALAILDPELRRCPLYDAGPATLYPAAVAP